MLGVVILAAGASRRMGQPKLFLRWGFHSVLGQVIAQWEKRGAAQIGVVLAPEINLPADGGRAEIIRNPQPERGMFSSIQAAAQWEDWQEGVTHWAVVLGDQPHLSDHLLEKLIQTSALNRSAIVQPFYEGRGRHPVILPRAFFSMLAEAREETLKDFLQNRLHAIAYEEIAEAGLTRDLDTPQDYEELQRVHL
jgi:molybdenum cofactor cytidylyltransferase